MSQTGVIGWSQTPASNANSDPNINWAEGMAPSALNDAARSTMTSIAKWRDDLNGSITTGGTSTAYTVTSNQVEAALTSGYVIAFVPHATNGSASQITLAVDGLTAKPLRTAPGSANELASGVLVQGTPYVATYYTTNSGEWILHSFYSNPYLVPIGGMMPYLGTTAPNSSFVLPYGQAIDRTTYASLFTLTSTAFGIGNGTTTFNVPDMRGRVPAGLGNMGGSDAARLTASYFGSAGTTVGATGGGESHTLTTAELATTTPTGTVSVTNITAHTRNITPTTGGVPIVTDAANDTAGSGNIIAAGWVTSTSATFTGASFGSSSPHAIVQPTIIVPYILRVI